MFDILVLIAKIYFGIGAIVGIVSIFAFFYHYETNSIDGFISSVEDKNLNSSYKISSKVKKLRKLNVPEWMLNILPYLGITLHTLQSIFIWPWQLYKFAT